MLDIVKDWFGFGTHGLLGGNGHSHGHSHANGHDHGDGATVIPTG